MLIFVLFITLVIFVWVNGDLRSLMEDRIRKPIANMVAGFAGAGSAVITFYSTMWFAEKFPFIFFFFVSICCLWWGFNCNGAPLYPKK